MKKLITSILMLAASFPSWSQTLDTLELGEREPTFYYWDTNWFDHYALHVTNSDQDVEWRASGWSGLGCEQEYARYCYTDTALRVIGVAAIMKFYICRPVPWFTDNPWDYLLEEYFRLYEVDSTTDEMILLAEGEWTKTQPRYVMEDGYNQHLYYNARTGHSERRKYMDTVYEVYFSKPQIVHDSFYVAVTENNNNCDNAPHSYVNVEVGATYMYKYMAPDDMEYYGPIPCHHRRKLHRVNTAQNNCDVDFTYFVSDTLWHTFSTTHNSPYATTAAEPIKTFLSIFPIIDTGWHMPLPEECPAPTGLSLLYVNNEVAVLTWNGTPAHQWQLAIARDGSGPENGTVYPCTSDLRAVTGLDTATWYTAWVRSICDNDSVSPWSDSVRFYVPSQPDGPISIGSANDAFVNIMPNPAKGLLNVFSSYRMGRIDIYTVTGSLAMSVDVSANSASVDISSLPAGNYLVRIYSTNGTSTKRLVVK